MSESTPETLEEFRKSFSYGSRNDLFFKFLASNNFSDQEAGEILRGLLTKLGEALDTGDYQVVREYVYQWQMRGYAPQEQNGRAPRTFQYDSAPWTPLSRPLSESRVTLISTGGLFVEGNDPLGPDGPTQEEAISQIADFLRRLPKIVTIPRDIDPDRLRVRHPGYDIRGAMLDCNVIFPIDRLRELLEEGVLGELAEDNYSFVGATSQRRLLAEAAPALAREIRSKKVDAALLVAA
ncbi:MAG: glycine/sarcosine/betaine reductase selenoprotein B family protein [Dehalococcoidia bacterium]